MGTASRLSSGPSASAADEPPEALGLGVLCVGVAEADADGEPDDRAGEGDEDGLFVVLGGGASLDGAAAGAPPAPDGSTGDASPSGDVSGALARTSSGSARFRSGASYENSPLAIPAAAITPAAAVPARVTTIPVRCRRRRLGCRAEGEAGEAEGPDEAGDAKGPRAIDVGSGVVDVDPRADGDAGTDGPPAKGDGTDGTDAGDAGDVDDEYGEGGAYGDVGDCRVGNSSPLGEVPGPSSPVSASNCSNIRTSAAFGRVAVAAVVTGMAIVGVWSGPDVPGSAGPVSGSTRPR